MDIGICNLELCNLEHGTELEFLLDLYVSTLQQTF